MTVIAIFTPQQKNSLGETLVIAQEATIHDKFKVSIVKNAVYYPKLSAIKSIKTQISEVSPADACS